MKLNHPTDSGLCQSIQPDGKLQRCIRFENHPGPHQTFVAEWTEGEPCSRRRQTREPMGAAPPAFRPAFPRRQPRRDSGWAALRAR
jgi:hypothetical protein